MNRKTKIVFALFVLIAASSVAYALTDTQIEILTPDTLKNGDGFNITLMGEDGTKLANEVVNITVTNEAGEQNNISATTDSNGFSSLTIDGVAPGKYNFNCTFWGNDKFAPVSADQNLTIEA